MKKEKKVEKTAVEEKKSSTIKEDKKTKKKNIREAKKTEKLAIRNEKEKVEEKIDSLFNERKELKKDKKKDLKENKKDKNKKKDIKSNYKNTKKRINRDIRNLKIERKEIGQKDTYLRDIKKEMKLVRWPSKEEFVKYTIACFAFIVLFALFFWIITFAFSQITGIFNK